MSPLSTRLGLLLALYLAQGVPFGVYTQALPAILRSYDAPLSLISLSGLLAIPWALKVFWSPIVDRYYWPSVGHRRSWILPMNIGLAAVMAGLCFFDPDSLRDPSGVYWLFGFLFLVNLFAATQDIATDGLAVRILSSEERGLGNGIQVSAYRVGIIIGGGLLLLVLDTLGWAQAFMGLTLMSLLLLLPVMFYREPPISAEALAGSRESYSAAWVSFFKRPELAGWIWVLVSYKIADSLSSAMVKPMMVDMGMSLAEIGLQVSMISAVTTIAGAMLGGYWLQKIGRRHGLFWFGAFQCVAIAAYAIPALGYGLAGLAATSTAVAINAIEHFAGGMAMAALLSAVMDRARQAHAGVDFTLQVSLLAIFGGSFYLPAGLLAEAVGYADHFVISAVIGVLMLYPAWRFTREPHELNNSPQPAT
ncbi:MFS transporter [Paraperlucidibaca baekdonensis]|uniref:MFS transporter n=1 Tax=Paraperlucidibaca baekdonensis TaxID=748120 RepID=A0A3E0H4E1_9GAMM|nr:MFS transporter [Paraperlucidibaca baekdonensis]REH37723.1 MFS transporter [Paraperlucidibaca baekdonensis]